MKTALAWFAAAVAVSITLAPVQGEISVTAATDFLSDVDATLAKHDVDKNSELTHAEMGDAAWMELTPERLVMGGADQRE